MDFPTFTIDHEQFLLHKVAISHDKADMTKRLQSTVDLIRYICISLLCNTSGVSSPRLAHQLCVLNI